MQTVIAGLKRTMGEVIKAVKADNIAQEIAIKSGVPKFHAHAARHWCGTTLLRENQKGKRMDIREVQNHIGHASLANTQVYTHLKGREVAKHASEQMGDFFRMSEIQVTSTNPNGTALGNSQVSPEKISFEANQICTSLREGKMSRPEYRPEAE